MYNVWPRPENTWEEGVKVGFSSKRYYFSRGDAVNLEPIAPANWQRNTETRGLNRLTFWTIPIPKIVLYPKCYQFRIKKALSFCCCFLQHFCKHMPSKESSNRTKKFTPFIISFNELYIHEIWNIFNELGMNTQIFPKIIQFTMYLNSFMFFIRLGNIYIISSR